MRSRGQRHSQDSRPHRAGRESLMSLSHSPQWVWGVSRAVQCSAAACEMAGRRRNTPGAVLEADPVTSGPPGSGSSRFPGPCRALQGSICAGRKGQQGRNCGSRLPPSPEARRASAAPASRNHGTVREAVLALFLFLGASASKKIPTRVRSLSSFPPPPAHPLDSPVLAFALERTVLPRPCTCLRSSPASLVL